MRQRHGWIGLIWIARAVAAVLVSILTVAAEAQGPSGTDASSRPRPGLTSQQTRRAVELADGAMRELRKKTEGASSPQSDPREYVVNVEMLAARAPKKGGKAAADRTKGTDQPATGPLLAVVTTYRYFDDSTVFSTVDVSSGKVVAVQQARHIHTALSDAEFEDAQTLARNQSDEVKKLYDQYGDQLDVYPQFSQFRVKNDERLHRVVHLNYRLGKRDLSYPRPQVDMTIREVTVPASEAAPAVRGRRP